MVKVLQEGDKKKKDTALYKEKECMTNEGGPAEERELRGKKIKSSNKKKNGRK